MAQNWTSVVESNWIFSKFYPLIYIYIYIYITIKFFYNSLNTYLLNIQYLCLVGTAVKAQQLKKLTVVYIQKCLTLKYTAYVLNLFNLHSFSDVGLTYCFFF